MEFRDVVLVADRVTVTGRIYPREILVREVERLRESVRNGSLIGQLEVPPSAAMSLYDASHIVTELCMEGDNLVAGIETLGTPYGVVLEHMILQGQALVLCPHGIGSVKSSGVVGDDYQLISICVCVKEEVE